MCERKILLCKKYVDATFCEQRAKRVLRMRYCMSKHITVSHTSIFKGENVFEKSDQISYSCKAENPNTSIFKVENVFEKSDQISYSCKAGNPHKSIFKVENVFEKSDQISYSCKAGIPLGLQRKYKDKRTFLEPSKVRRSASLQFEDAL